MSDELTAALARVAELEQEAAVLRARSEQFRREAERATADVQRLRASTSWRVSSPVRAFAPLRTALQGPPGTRRSLRNPAGRRALIRSLRQHGLRHTLRRLRQELRASTRSTQYADWVSAYDTLDDADRSAIGRHVAALSHRPTFSVVMSAYDTRPDELRAALDSVVQPALPRLAADRRR